MKNFTLAVIRKGLPKHAFTNNLFNVGRRPLWGRAENTITLGKIGITLGKISTM